MGKNNKKKQPVSALIAAQRQPLPQSASAFARLPRDKLRAVGQHLYRDEQMGTIANLALTCRRIEGIVKPLLCSRVSWDEESWAAEKKGLAEGIPEQWKHVRHVFLTGQNTYCDWWWQDLVRLAPQYKTRDSVTHHFFPSIQFVAETVVDSRDVKSIKYPYTFWLSTRNIAQFDAAFMEGLIAAVGRMHRKRGGKMKGIAEDRVPGFHSTFEPYVPSTQMEDMVAQVNQITSKMAKTSIKPGSAPPGMKTTIKSGSFKAGPAPSGMKATTILRTDAMIYLEPGLNMDILFFEDQSGKSSRIGRLRRIVELFFALKTVCAVKIKKLIMLSVDNHDFANFEGWIQAIITCPVNSDPCSNYLLNLILTHKITPEQFEDEMFGFYCETILPNWQRGAALPSSAIIEANTLAGGSDADLREAHIRLDPKDPKAGALVCVVQWSSATPPPPGQPDSIYMRTINCHTREVVEHSHKETIAPPKNDKAKRRILFKGLPLR